MDGRMTLEWHTFSGRQRRILALIALLYLLLALNYMLATPPLEASDEYKHYPFVQYVQAEGKLPVLRVEDPGRWLQEAAQPPLYYLLMALLTAPIDTSDLPEIHQVNKYAFVGDPNQVGNKNLIIHRPEQEAFPWQGTVLAVYVIRLASIALGLGTVLLAGRLGLLVAGGRVGLLAAALTAFNPMFLFVNAAVNNDSLAILLGTAGLYWLVRLWREDPHPAGQPRPYLFLGLLLGLGLLTKLSLGGLLGLALLALAWRAWQRRDGRYLLYGALWLALPALLLPLPWFWRNLQLYGDPTGLAVFIAVQDKRDGLPTLADWLGEFGSFYRSYWGLFGGVNVAAPQIIYGLLNGLALVGAAGLGWWLWRQRPRLSTPILTGGLWLLAAWLLIMFALLLRWNLYSASFQGRLIFPALPAANTLWAIGLLALVRPAERSLASLAIAGLLALIAALLPWITIRPAYAFPEPVLAVPAEAHFGPISFYDQGIEVLRLVGVEMAPGQRVRPGNEPVAVTLYWQATEETAAQQKDYLTAVTLLGRNLEVAGQVNRHPAGGMIPARDWQPGQIWQDVYHIYPAAETLAPSLLRVRASVYDPAAAQDLEARDPQGNVLDLLLVGEAVLEATGRPPAPSIPQEVTFQHGITFRGYDLQPQPVRPGETLTVTLYWQANDTPTQDYTLFLHLLDPAGTQVVVADAPPLNGDYPTRLWQAGDWIVDSRPVVIPAEVPAGEYTIAIGFYDPRTGERLPLASGDEGAIALPVVIGE